MQKKQRKAAGKRKKSSAVATSKKDQMIALLKQPDGVTLQDLMSASGWQAHSVRGFLSGVLVKKMGMKITSERRDEGQRVYRIA